MRFLRQFFHRDASFPEETAAAMPARRIGPPLFYAAALFYLAFHALNGERGLYALVKENRKLEALKQESTLLAAQRASLEHRARLLNDQSLDLDLVDEQARRMLGFSAQDEAIVILPKGKAE